MMAEAGCKSLNIGNIDPRVDERLLNQILSQAGGITTLRIVPDHNYTYGGLSTGFVEYDQHSSADAAMVTLNGQQIYDYPITLTWAISSVQSAKKEDTSSHFHVWIGDIAPEVDDGMLVQAFAQFESVSDARVMWDPNTGKSRGYGFVSFREKSDAERAINLMNGYQLGSKKIRCNWAHQRTAAVVNTGPSGGVSGAYSSTAAFIPPTRPTLNYNYVLNQTSPMHTTIYLGNVPPNVTIDMLQPVFRPYGFVMDIKVTADRGFAFIKMDTHENAATAICYINGLVFNGVKLKCSWGRERTDAYTMPQQQSHSHSQPSAASASAYASNPYYAAYYGQQQAAATGGGSGGYPAGYEQYYNQYSQYYAQYYAQQQQQQQAAGGYDQNAGSAAALAQYQQQQQQQQQPQNSENGEK